MLLEKLKEILDAIKKLLEKDKRCEELEKENEELKKEVKRYLPSFRFQFSERVSGDEIYEALRNAFPKASIRMADAYYDIIMWDELLQWLNEDSLNEMKWCEDVWDCDDFADQSACRMHLLGRIQNKNFAYRIAWGNTPLGYHAFCLAYVLKNEIREIVIIEPQNDDTKEWRRSDYKPDYIKF
jgi:uncharacterized protein YhaN